MTIDVLQSFPYTDIILNVVWIYKQALEGMKS